jgi:hypothetical protein
VRSACNRDAGFFVLLHKLIRSYLSGVVRALSFLSTTNTASSFAGSVALALRLTA